MRDIPKPVYDGEGRRLVRSFVRRQGRMSVAKWERYDQLAKRYILPFANSLSDPRHFFASVKPLVLEIGFGMGHATIEIAESNPHINYLGVEVHIPGVAALMERIDDRGVDNLKIIQHDAVEVLKYMIQDDSLSGVHIFFPDPWPKKRHFKRRLIQRQFLELLTPKLLGDGYIYLATDWEDYAIWMQEVLDAFPGVKNQYDGFAEPQSWRPETAFERKGLEKRYTIRELFYRKID